MVFGDRSIHDLTFEDLQALVDNRVPEGPHIDYKQNAYSGRDEDKREMLRDIVALANAKGGYLILGIIEDSSSRAVGFAPIVDAHQIAQSIRQTYLDGIQERIPGIDIRVIEAEENQGIIVIFVPASEQLPHMVAREHRTDFYRRYGTDKRSMTIGEIRDGFLYNPIYRRMVELELIAQNQIKTGIERVEETPTYLQIITDRAVEKFLQRYLISSVRAQSLVIVSPFISDLSGEPFSLENILIKAQKDRATIFVITQEPHEEYHQRGLAVFERSPSVEIRYNPNIHAKLYICWSREEEDSFALFGSGNLTIGGLKQNIELGMMILSRGYGKRLIRELFNWGVNDLRVDPNSRRIKSFQALGEESA